MQITFIEPIERNGWFEKDCLVFWADADGRQVKCVVSRTFLRVGFGAESAPRDKAIERFNGRRPEIESLLSKMIEEGRLNEKGEAVL